MTVPPFDVIRAVVSDTTETIARIEILESDRQTVWLDEVFATTGSVGADSNRLERRNFQGTLDNTDGSLDNHPDGFWYDKIIKPYRGVRYNRRLLAAEQVLADQPVMYFRLGETQGNFKDSGSFGKEAVASAGLTRTGHGAFVGDDDGSISPSGGNRATISDSPAPTRTCSISYWWRTNSPAQATTVKHSQGAYTIAHNYGQADRFYFSDGSAGHVAEVPGLRNSVWHMLFITVGEQHTKFYIDGDLKYVSPSSPQPRFGHANGDVFLGSADSYHLEGDLDEVAFYDYEVSADRIKIQYRAGRGDFLTETATWETPLGCFQIDGMNADDFPNVVQVSGRDYMKGLLLSKFRQATAFEPGMPIEELVRVIASNGGVPHNMMILPPTGLTVDREFFFERHAPRAESLKEIGDAFGFEVYFDAYGMLNLRPFSDPSTSPTTHTFKTGPEGNLVKFSKSARDTRIFNVVVACGESQDLPPVWHAAENRNENSPTRIQKLGERVDEFVSPLITTEAQARETAEAKLKISALEEFEVNMGSLVFPWLEPGGIVRFEDPDPNPGEPDRYLMTDFTVPLSLGAMDTKAKRITIVGTHEL